jgi:hypothetical protein
MPDATKWALFDLLKVLDTVHGGQLHSEFSRIAQGLGLELPSVAPPPDPAPDSEDEADGEQESEQARVYEFLAAQTEPVGLARIVAGLRIKRWTINSALYRLLKNGSVEHVGHDAWRVRGAG